MRRFISRMPEYVLIIPNRNSGNEVEIIRLDNRKGLETDDPYIIERITRHADFGNLILELESQEALKQSAIAHARQVLEAAGMDYSPISVVPIEPLSTPDVTIEERELQQEQQIKEDQEAAEAAQSAERKAKNDAIREAYKSRGKNKRAAGNGEE